MEPGQLDSHLTHHKNLPAQLPRLFLVLPRGSLVVVAVLERFLPRLGQDHDILVDPTVPFRDWAISQHVGGDHHQADLTLRRLRHGASGQDWQAQECEGIRCFHGNPFQSV